MANAITHRGPDDSGVWVDPEAGIALAHRRLSILDLSSTGHQPMVSASGRYVIVFNGEIYNYKQFGDYESDTDCITDLYLANGYLFPKKLDGEFAIALYDFKSKTLIVASDSVIN